MEFNFKSNSPYSYIRYERYVGVYNKEKELYLVPKIDGSSFGRDIYDMFSKIDSILVDLLNIGRICIQNDDDAIKEDSVYSFVQKYGLLGFMVDSPINPDFMFDKEVVLKEDNFIDKNKRVYKSEEYFKLFFPFATKEQMSYTIKDNKVIINTNSELQKMLNQTSIYNQLIYSSFYCEKIDWIIEYAKKMYKIYENISNLSEQKTKNYNEDVNNYTMSGVPYKINMYGTTPEICWQPNSLKQALDLAFGFMICSQKNPIRTCKYCGTIFCTKNPKAEYDTPNCRNKANVYKSRSKNKVE